ncbi:MAG: hypothetical protein ACP5NZ_02735 [Nanobdellota archaeon]
MGFIRGIFVTFFSIILFIALIFMNLTLIISLSLEHDTLQPALKNSTDAILSNYLAEGSMFSEEEKMYMENYCSIESEYIFTYENYTFPIPCKIIEEGENSTVNYITDNFIEVIYYEEYNCEFWQCVKSSSIPFVLISKKARDYWNENFMILLGLSLLIFALTFLISNDRPGRFIVGGVLIVFSALPFRSLDWALIFVPDNFSSIVSVFFTKAHFVFMTMLIIGILFIVFGILCKIFGWKMKFHKDEEVKGNVQKKKK